MHSSPPQPRRIVWKSSSSSQKKSKRICWQLLFSVVSCTLGASFQFGFSTGFVNNMQVYMEHYFQTNGIEPAEGSEEHFRFFWSIAVSGFAIGGMIGTFLFPALANKIGRKRCILSTTVPCFMSCYLIAFPRSWSHLIAGRILVGIGAGGACGTVPGYITEISPLELKGTLGTVHQLMITIGIFVAQALTTARFNLFGNDQLWQYVLLVPFFCTVFLLSTLPFCAESPAYLLQQHREEEAKDALRWLRPKTEDAQKRIYREVRQMNDELSLSNSDATLKDFLQDELLWKPLLVGSIVNLSMQFSGIDAVFYYSTNVFLSAGLELSMAQVCTTAIGLANVLVTIPAMLFMDKAGRKVIQIVGLSGMCVSHVLMTVALVNELHGLALIAMVGIICFFAFGPGCIAWFIIAELVPIHARGTATTVALAVNWTANWFIAFIFPHILAYLGKWTFGIFAVSTAILSTYTYFFLPETKGKTVLEIRETFSSSNLLPTVGSYPTLQGFGGPLLTTEPHTSSLAAPLLSQSRTALGGGKSADLHALTGFEILNTLQTVMSLDHSKPSPFPEVVSIKNSDDLMIVQSVPTP